MSYTAEIIGVGTELLLGGTANTDAQEVSRTLSELGINVYFHTVVGDNPGRLLQAVEIAKGRADIIITTGGLGPTYDDLTKETVAAAFGKKLVYHEGEAEKIRAFFEKRLRGARMTENNLRQAYLPQDSEVLSNGVGTAPGCAFYAGGKHVLMLPGPPRECAAMMNGAGARYLRSLQDTPIYSRNIHIFGMGESEVEARLRDMMTELTNPTLAPYAKEGEVQLRVTARAASGEEADALMRPVIEAVRAALGDLVYGVDTQSLENTVVGLLTERALTLAAAESCTGGLFSKRITDIPGASRVFPGGAVTYSPASKTALLGVPPELLEAHTPVSREVALAMARGARARFGADLGVGITGAAGPGPDEDGHEAGTVFIALSGPDGEHCRQLKLFPDRERARGMAAGYALDMVRRSLTGLAVEGS